MSIDTSNQSEIDSGTLGTQSLTVASLTGASRVFGLARDVVLSSFFGAGYIADAFFVAFRIPNFFRRLLAEGAFAQAFVPVLSEYQESRNRQELERFVQAVAGNFGVVLIAICIVGVVLSPVLVTVFTLGGWRGDSRHELATGLLRIMFPYLGLISLTAFVGAILNSFGRFSVPAFTPVLLNVALIAGGLYFGRTFEQPVYALAWAVIVAGVLQFAFHMPSLAALKLLKFPRIDWRSKGTRQMLRLLVPAVYAASAGQINILVGTILAASLTVGSVSWLYYADRLIELPVGMIAIAIQTVILPNLSKLHSRDDREGFQNSLSWGVRVAIFLGAPATVGLCCVSVPLISTLFFRGEFEVSDIYMVAIALQAFAIGILPLMLVRVAAPGFYARHDTATPFKYASIGVAVNIVVSLCLFKLIGHVGIAIATSVAAGVQCILLMRGLAVRGDLVWSRSLSQTCVQAALACVAMTIVLVLLAPNGEFWIAAKIWSRIGWTSLLLGVGMASYFAVLFLFGVRIRHFLGHV